MHFIDHITAHDTESKILDSGITPTDIKLHGGASLIPYTKNEPFIHSFESKIYDGYPIWLEICSHSICHPTINYPNYLNYEAIILIIPFSS